MLAFSPLIYRDLFHASDVGTMKVNEIANLADVSPDTVRCYNLYLLHISRYPTREAEGDRWGSTGCS